jgi:hypothetical protein
MDTVPDVLTSGPENNKVDCLLLNVFQSVELKYPSVETPDWVIPIVPVVVIVPPVIGAVVPTDVRVPPEPLALIVSVSVVSLVVIVTPEPATTVRVSSLVSAIIVDWPATAMFLKIFCDEPLSLLVTVIDPLVVIGPPLTVIPVPAVRSTLVTVPTN